MSQKKNLHYATPECLPSLPKDFLIFKQILMFAMWSYLKLLLYREIILAIY